MNVIKYDYPSIKFSNFHKLADLVNLTYLIAEQAPFLQTYAGTDYFDDAAANFINQENLQRGTWRVSGG